MKKRTTLLKLSLIALFSIISNVAFSATYYVCQGSTLNLAPAAMTDITYSWDVKQGGTSLPGYPRAAVPTTLPAAGTYEVILISSTTNPNICAPDVVSNDFIVLPTLSITLDAPTNPTYCGVSTGIKSSLVGQTTVGFPAGVPYDTDIEAEYSYSVVKDSEPAADGLGFGTIDATGKYTLTTTTPGVYKITGTVKYKQKTGATGTLLSASGCPASSTTSVQTITVTDKPAQPVITISAN